MPSADRAPAGAPPRVVQVRTAGGTDAELAADALWRAGAAAVEERAVAGGVLLVAGTTDGDPTRLLAAVTGRWPAETAAVDAEAPLDAWRPYARAVVAGPFVVRPPWVPVPTATAGRVPVVIDPGRAFGSGGHPSTRLALQALAPLVAPGTRVLDVGCGSGVLAIAALALGAAGAVALDIDPAALAATRANAARNGVHGRLTVTGTPVAARRDTFDVVVANLLAPQLVELAPALRARLAQPGRGIRTTGGDDVGPGGLVVSGLLADQLAAVTDAFAATGLAVARAGRADAGGGDWVAVTFRPRPGAPS